MLTKTARHVNKMARQCYELVPLHNFQTTNRQVAWSHFGARLDLSYLDGCSFGEQTTAFLWAVVPHYVAVFVSRDIYMLLFF